jgi:hypothetical protein
VFVGNLGLEPDVSRQDIIAKRARAERRTGKSNAKKPPIRTRISEKELSCKESDAQPAVEVLSIRSDQRIGPVRTTASH